jgi:hypothetical protein
LSSGFSSGFGSGAGAAVSPRPNSRPKNPGFCGFVLSLSSLAI